MASLYKRTYWSTDPETGERVRKKTANWYGKYKNADGIQVRVPLSSNKVASEQMLAELVRTVELGKAGLIDPFETHRKRPLREHLTDFRQHLESKGNSEPHVDLTVSRVTAALTGAGFKVLGDLNADKVANWLKKQRDNKDKKKRFGVATSNHYLVAVKSFGNWLLRSERLERNPFVHLSRLNSKVDVRVKHRALDPEELTRLIDAAQLSTKRFRELTGPDRAALYLVATMTGLRTMNSRHSVVRPLISRPVPRPWKSKRRMRRLDEEPSCRCTRSSSHVSQHGSKAKMNSSMPTRFPAQLCYGRGLGRKRPRRWSGRIWPMLVPHGSRKSKWTRRSILVGRKANSSPANRRRTRAWTSTLSVIRSSRSWLPPVFIRSWPSNWRDTRRSRSRWIVTATASCAI